MVLDNRVGRREEDAFLAVPPPDEERRRSVLAMDLDDQTVPLSHNLPSDVHNLPSFLSYVQQQAQSGGAARCRRQRGLPDWSALPGLHAVAAILRASPSAVRRPQGPCACWAQGESPAFAIATVNDWRDRLEPGRTRGQCIIAFPAASAAVEHDRHRQPGARPPPPALPRRPVASMPGSRPGVRLSSRSCGTSQLICCATL